MSHTQTASSDHGKPIAFLELRAVDRMERSNARAEDWCSSVDINRFWQMDAIWLVDNSIFCEETIRREPLKQLLAGVAVEVMNHAAFALKATSDNVKEANWIAIFVTLVLNGRMHFLNISSAFMSKCCLM